ncbi:kinase-like domain-containing protein [Lactifluus subvellereus]|nr:kinase-like domain-containing protein [Lactifluus subvellereus]
MVEVQSDINQRNRTRMLLQAACMARLGRLFYNPFIVVALYIENSGQVTRYFLFQRDDADRKVSYVSDIQHWTQPSDLFTAISEIYNLVSIIQSDRPELGNIQERIELLSSDLSKNFKDTFMSKRTQYDTNEGGSKPTKRPRSSPGGQGGNTGNGLRHGEHVYHDRQVVDAFTRAGYTLESNDEDENGWEPMNKLKPTMRHAIQSSGTAVVVKLLRLDSSELPILQYLHSIKSPYNHTIPLLRTLNLNVGTFIMLPEATPLDLGFTLGMFRNEVVDFSRQLIAGVAFLHRHNIAHLDIKPQNIVALQNQLFIIDFDISVRVDGPDALIDRWCGTPKWMAPEIGHEDGPKCLYSPIRADLWSCGLMLRYLASKGVVKGSPFATLARQLLNKNPQLRPLLYLQSSGLVTGSHPLGDLNGRLKRKPDPLPLLHDAKRLAT